MTDEEKKAWDKFVSSYCDPRIIQQSKSVPAILAADAELKRLREEIVVRRVVADNAISESNRLWEAVEWVAHLTRREMDAIDDAASGLHLGWRDELRRRAKEG